MEQPSTRKSGLWATWRWKSTLTVASTRWRRVWRIISCTYWAPCSDSLYSSFSASYPPVFFSVCSGRITFRTSHSTEYVRTSSVHPSRFTELPWTRNISFMTCISCFRLCPCNGFWSLLTSSIFAEVVLTSISFHSLRCCCKMNLHIWAHFYMGRLFVTFSVPLKSVHWSAILVAESSFFRFGRWVSNAFVNTVSSDIKTWGHG